jgi:hypothetical protein
MRGEGWLQAVSHIVCENIGHLPPYRGEEGSHAFTNRPADGKTCVLSHP